MTKVKPWAIALTEKHFGGSPFKIGDKVIHKRHGLVVIVDGQYWGTYGISNFWDWQKVLPDGSISKGVYHGYGNENEGFIFEKEENKLERE